MDLVKEIRELEAKGVYIHLGHEHYSDGSNCNWAIEALTDKREQKFHTSWYGDNHEFGDTIGCYEAAIRFANWLIEGDNAEWFFSDIRETVTKEGHAKWLKRQEYLVKADEIVFGKKKICPLCEGNEPDNVSSCCGAYPHGNGDMDFSDIGICSDCGEHCTYGEPCEDCDGTGKVKE